MYIGLIKLKASSYSYNCRLYKHEVSLWLKTLVQSLHVITVKLSIAEIAHAVTHADKHTFTTGSPGSTTLLLRLVKLCDISHVKTLYSAAYSLTTL